MRVCPFRSLHAQQNSFRLTPIQVAVRTTSRPRRQELVQCAREPEWRLRISCERTRLRVKLALFLLTYRHHDHEICPAPNFIFLRQRLPAARCAAHIGHRADRDRARRGRAGRSAAHGHGHAFAINAGTDGHRDAAAEFIAIWHAATDDQYRHAFTDSDTVSDRDAANDKHNRAFAFPDRLVSSGCWRDGALSRPVWTPRRASLQ